MARGFISGVVWGLIFSIGSLWIVSQIGGVLRVLSAPEQVAESAPEAVVSPNVVAEAEPPATVPDELPEPVAPPATDVQSLSVDEPPATGTQPAAPPVAEPVAELGEVPDIADEAVTAGGTDDTIIAETAALPVPPEAEAAPEALQAPEPLANNDIEPDSSPAPAENALSVGALPEPDSGPRVTANAAEPARPVTDSRPVVDFSTPVEVELPEEAEVAVVEPEAPAPAVEPQVVDLGNEASPTEDRDFASGPVVVNRPGADVAEDVTEPAGEEEESLDGLPALQAYARPFENPENRPLMAIVLLADAGSTLAADGSELPLPITYAVDASSEEATSLMRKARELGQEVLALAPLADRARPGDVATAFEIYLDRVPQAVGVIDTPKGAFQSGREIAAQITALIAPKGMGMVTYSRGLNSGLQVAARDDVPAAVVFNQIDEGDRDRDGIKRFLDQAAFKAGQQSGVVLFGHDRPETIAAIMEWSLGNRASTVTIAPVSALLSK